MIHSSIYKISNLKQQSCFWVIILLSQIKTAAIYNDEIQTNTDVNVQEVQTFNSKFLIIW